MALSKDDADVIINRLMERMITVGPEDGPTHEVVFSALLRYIDDNASVARNTITEANIKQWIGEALAGKITLTVSTS